jgi:uncharacterized damage-inducible protein DinB
MPRPSHVITGVCDKIEEESDGEREADEQFFGENVEEVEKHVVEVLQSLAWMEEFHERNDGAVVRYCLIKTIQYDKKMPVDGTTAAVFGRL